MDTTCTNKNPSRINRLEQDDTNTHKTHICPADRFRLPKILRLLRLLWSGLCSSQQVCPNSCLWSKRGRSALGCPAVWQQGGSQDRIQGATASAHQQPMRRPGWRFASLPLNMNTRDASVKHTQASSHPMASLIITTPHWGYDDDASMDGQCAQLREGTESCRTGSPWLEFFPQSVSDWERHQSRLGFSHSFPRTLFFLPTLELNHTPWHTQSLVWELPRSVRHLRGTFRER